MFSQWQSMSWRMRRAAEGRWPRLIRTRHVDVTNCPFPNDSILDGIGNDVLTHIWQLKEAVTRVLIAEWCRPIGCTGATKLVTQGGDITPALDDCKSDSINPLGFNQGVFYCPLISVIYWECEQLVVLAAQASSPLRRTSSRHSSNSAEYGLTSVMGCEAHPERSVNSNKKYFIRVFLFLLS